MTNVKVFFNSFLSKQVYYATYGGNYVRSGEKSWA